MRALICGIGWFFILFGLVGGIKWMETYLPGVNELTKDGVLSMIGLTWIAILAATMD